MVENGKKFTLTITMNDGNVHLHSDTPVNPLELLHATFSAQISILESTVEKANKLFSGDIVTELKNDLYDKYNFAASNTLAMFAPELELRPNLTTKAILEAENNILEREAEC